MMPTVDKVGGAVGEPPERIRVPNLVPPETRRDVSLDTTDCGRWGSGI